MCVVFQFVPQAVLTWNILEFPSCGLIGHPSRCSDSPTRHWLWRFYPRFIDWVIPGYQTGTFKAAGLSYGKPCRIYQIGGQCGAGGHYISSGQGVIWPLKILGTRKNTSIYSSLWNSVEQRIGWSLCAFKFCPCQNVWPCVVIPPSKS